MSDFAYFACKDIGVSGTTPVVIKKAANGFIARVGIALLGQANMSDKELEECPNPFHPDFHDNYAEGVGYTEQAAIENMKKDLSSIADSLWH